MAIHKINTMMVSTRSETPLSNLVARNNRHLPPVQGTSPRTLHRYAIETQRGLTLLSELTFTSMARSMVDEVRYRASENFALRYSFGVLAIGTLMAVVFSYFKSLCDQFDAR